MTIRIPVSHIESIKTGGIAELREALQKAIKLEHATLPPYLYALYSLGSTNPDAATRLRSVAMEEMLHMAIACNVLNAIGGKPAIDDPTFIPTYPGPLPYGIDGITVHLDKLTNDQLIQFRRIETPVDPLDIPAESGSAMLAAAPAFDPTYATIGDFYAAVIDALDPSYLLDPAPNQVSILPGLDPITSHDVAVQQLQLIVEQGEGQHGGQDPFESGKTPAHYYRFGELLKGGTLTKQPSGRYIYDTDKPVRFAPDSVPNVTRDPDLSNYSGDVLDQANKVNQIYSDMLRNLHAGFNGDSSALITAAYTDMPELRSACASLMGMQIEDSGVYAGPTFTYVPAT